MKSVKKFESAKLSREDQRNILGGKEQPILNFYCACGNNYGYSLNYVSVGYALASIDTYCGDSGGACYQYNGPVV